MAAWASKDEELHTAVQPVRTGVLHAAVEGLGETGWDWHVWDTGGRVQQYGLADTLEEALGKAEQAMERLARQLGPEGFPEDHSTRQTHADAELG